MKKTKEPKLKPCPFCGGDPRLTRHMKGDMFASAAFVISCENYYCFGHNPYTVATIRKTAMERWNKRHEIS